MKTELTGYVDKLSVRPGQVVHFMVSTDLPDYEVTIVRLIHADENPAGPGYKEIAIEASVNRRYRGQKQVVRSGSFVVIPDHEALRQLRSFTLQAWIYPTTPQKHEVQGLITKWSPVDCSGYGLGISTAGDLEFWIGNGPRMIERIGTGQTLRPKLWYFVAAAYDADCHSLRLYQRPLSDLSMERPLMIEKCIQSRGFAQSDLPLLMASTFSEGVVPLAVFGHGLYNGKLDSPRVFGRALTTSEIEGLARGNAPQTVGCEALVAAWDFANNFSGSKIIDTGPHGLHGSSVNMPARGMTGYNWSGSEFDFRHATAEYGAIYFHEDDLENSHWETAFKWTIPDNTISGYYAARLTSGDNQDHIPFIVCAKQSSTSAPIGFLAPSFSYLAYANDRMETLARHAEGITDRPIIPGELDRFLAEHPEFGRSLYDHHRDGMRCIYSSSLRPIISIRPKYRYWLTGAPRHFSADLYLIDWLEAKGLPYDVITDHGLHAEGQDLLARYRVVITGSHPEYWTASMLKGAQAYLNAGGRLMYLGGNGMYWVTGVDLERPHVIEVRRSLAGFMSDEAAPGEGHLSTTGEVGGLWRGRGLAPNRIAGVGFTAQGWAGRAPGYVRQPGSFDPRAAFIFEGVGPEEVIGDFGLVLGGAAGDELDRIDIDLGTPPHTLVLASSCGHHQSVTPVLEDVPEISASIFGANNPNIRADMVYFETPKGGAVFSVGSICWFGSLSHNHYNNNVSRITENVVRQFMS